MYIYIYTIFNNFAGPVQVLRGLTHCPCFFDRLLEGPPDISVKTLKIVMLVTNTPKYDLFVFSSGPFFIGVFRPQLSIQREGLCV